MKPIIKVILWCAAIVFIVRGCFMYTEMTHLSKDDLKWVTGYYKDNATFVSDSGNVSKLTRWSEYIHNRTDPFAYTFETGSKYEANAGYEFKVIDNRYEFDGYFDVIRVIDNDSLNCNFNFGKRQSKPQISVIKTDTFTIADKVFQDCIVAYSLNTYIPPRWIEDTTLVDFEKFVFSKEYGLIYYQLASGEQFYRKFE